MNLKIFSKIFPRQMFRAGLVFRVGFRYSVSKTTKLLTLTAPSETHPQ